MTMGKNRTCRVARACFKKREEGGGAKFHDPQNHPFIPGIVRNVCVRAQTQNVVNWTGLHWTALDS